MDVTLEEERHDDTIISDHGVDDSTKIRDKSRMTEYYTCIVIICVLRMSVAIASDIKQLVYNSQIPCPYSKSITFHSSIVSAPRPLATADRLISLPA